MTLSNAGLADGLIQTRKIGNETLKKVLGLLILVNLILFLIQFALAPLLAAYYEESIVERLAIVLAFVFLMAPWISVPQALLMRELDFKANSIVFLVASLVGVGVSLAMAWKGYGVWSLVFGFVTNNVVQIVGMQLIKPTLVFPSFNFSSIRRIIYFGGAVTITSLLWSVYIRADVFIAGRVLDTSIVGIYATAIELATLPMTKLMPIINQVVFPVFSRIQIDSNLVEESYRKGILLFSIISFPVFLGIAAVAPEFVPLFLGKKWIGVVDPLIVLCFSIPFRSAMNIFAPVLRGLGRPEIVLKNVVFSMIAVIGSFLIGVRWGRSWNVLCLACCVPCCFRIFAV